MKKSKIMLAGIMTVAVCGMLTACGKKEENVVEETKPTMYAKERNLYGSDDDDVSDDDTDAESDKPTEQSEIDETAENDTEETAEQGTSEEMTAEQAMELCQKAYDALSSSEDMAEIARTCDMELCYYFETGELVDDIEELTAYTGEFLETAVDSVPLNFIVISGVAVEDINWDSATKLSRKKTTGWNKFIQEYMKDIFNESPAGTYEFEETWAVDVSEKEMDSSGETEDSHIVAGYDFENPMFLVVKHNGTWKADLLLPMTRQIFNGLTETPVEETADEIVDSDDEEAGTEEGDGDNE